MRIARLSKNPDAQCGCRLSQENATCQWRGAALITPDLTLDLTKAVVRVEGAEMC
jgi:hypothetical protein